MDTEQANHQLTLHLIDKYREMLSERYNYADISERFGLPSFINETDIDDVKVFFMQSMYPPAQDRERVDAAFDSLKHYITDPIKIWGLLGNMANAVIRFGTQFPAALKAGMHTLGAYTDAKKFERKMLDSANELGYAYPLNDEQFMACLKGIPRDEAEEFIDDVAKLFNALSDTILLRKTIGIMKDVAISMKNKPTVYPSKDIEGIYLGIGILESGLTLFKKMDSTKKNTTLRVILQNERWFLDQVYKK